MYGVLLSAVTEEVLLDVYRVYSRVCGGRGAESWVSVFEKNAADIKYRHETLNDLLVNRNFWFEDRLGSSLMVIDCHRGDKPVEDRDAKLLCKLVRSIWYGSDRDCLVELYFDPNIAEGDEAIAMTKAFEEAIDEFLVEKGIAIELK
jgi:hypothetical protein